ncbi:MAG: hypothetical protein JNL80_12400 [Phycisphaerae bacterium]|nr:hypothetical protein [Phycisphaerae bacterium]
MSAPLFASIALPTELLLGLLAVAGIAVISAECLRRIGLSGAPMAAGVLVGILLGPGVAGRIIPDRWTSTFEGPPTLLAAATAASRERDALLFALGDPSVIGADSSEALATLERAAREADAAWSLARERHRNAGGFVLLGLAAIVLLASGGATSVRAPVRRHQRTEAFVHALWWCAAGVGGAALLLWVRGDALLTTGSCLIGAAACCGPWCIGREDRLLAEGVVPEGGPLLEQSGRIANILALTLAAAALLLREELPHRAACLIVLCLLPIGWLVRMRLASVAERVALPALVAILCLSVEPFRDIGFLLPLAMYVVLEDARWIGGWIGLRLSERAGLTDAARITFASLTVEPLIVVFVAVGTVTGSLSPELAGSALLGATGIAILSKARRQVALHLADA